MAYDYFTLQALGAELRSRLLGRRIEAVASGPWGLQLHCDAVSLRLHTGRRGVLFLRQGQDARPVGRLPASGEPYLIRAAFVDVQLGARDRVVRLRLQRQTSGGRLSHGWLVVELIWPHVLAALIRERDGEILGLWGRRGPGQSQLALGGTYRDPEGPARLLPGRERLEAFAAAVGSQAAERLAKACARVLAMMDRECMAAILAELGCDPEVRAGAVDARTLAAIWRRCEELYCRAPSGPCVVWADGSGWHFSVMGWRAGGNAAHARDAQAQEDPGSAPRQGDDAAGGRTDPRPHAAAPGAQAGDPAPPCGSGSCAFPSVSAATERWLELEHHAAQAGQRERRARAGLSRLRSTLARRVQALEGDLQQAAAAELVERQGSALLAHLSRVPAGQAWAELADVHDLAGTRRLAIDLDPRLTPAQNAAAYLKRARRLYRRREVVPARLARCRAALEEVSAAIRTWQPGDSDSLLKAERLLAEFRQMRRTAAPLRAESGSEAHPRRYRTSTGWSVWAGRNNRENDLLTHRLAAPNDYWFHAHGYAGAHVILRREGRQEEPSRSTLAEAAALAAYWSKGKTARRVPVVWALAKHVSRVRGGPPGQAIVRHERTIMVEPKLLAAEDAAP